MKELIGLLDGHHRAKASRGGAAALRAKLPHRHRAMAECRARAPRRRDRLCEPSPRRLARVRLAADLLGKRPLDIVYPPDHPIVTGHMRRTAGGIAPIRDEVRLVRRDGTTVATEGQGTLLDFDGKPSTSSSIATSPAGERCSSGSPSPIECSLGTLAAGVRCHEINTPLAYVQMNLDVLAKAATAGPKSRARRRRRYRRRAHRRCARRGRSRERDRPRSELVLAAGTKRCCL